MSTDLIALENIALVNFQIFESCNVQLHYTLAKHICLALSVVAGTAHRMLENFRKLWLEGKKVKECKQILHNYLNR